MSLSIPFMAVGEAVTPGEAILHLGAAAIEWMAGEGIGIGMLHIAPGDAHKFIGHSCSHLTINTETRERVEAKVAGS